MNTKTMITITDEWVTDQNGNKASIKYWGDIRAAIDSLDSLVNCQNCINCLNCLDCKECTLCFSCSHCTDVHRAVFSDGTKNPKS